MGRAWVRAIECDCCGDTIIAGDKATTFKDLDRRAKAEGWSIRTRPDEYGRKILCLECYNQATKERAWRR